ncbi:MAG: LysM peptidoglycan-binding domain-containing protein [Actinobacteria bacterium]|nr:LysM peptidoglycan-binding domain-containing protein [Actinomycetota bacterium]
MTAPAQLRTRPAADDHAPNRALNNQAVPIRHTLVLCPAPPVMAPRPRPAPSVRTASARPGVKVDRRPTQWDRVLRVAGAAAVTLAVVGALSWLGQAASAGLPTETSVVRVGAGETVWDVAVRVAPESDPRAVVQRIRELNGMTSSAVQPGQQLQVPDGR